MPKVVSVVDLKTVDSFARWMRGRMVFVQVCVAHLDFVLWSRLWSRVRCVGSLAYISFISRKVAGHLDYLVGRPSRNRIVALISKVLRMVGS